MHLNSFQNKKFLICELNNQVLPPLEHLHIYHFLSNLGQRNKDAVTVHKKFIIESGKHTNKII